MNIDHIERPMVPWRRSERLTECGLTAENHPTISREEFLKRVRDMGQERSAMVTCMTCWHTARRWPSWEEDPVQAVVREAHRWRAQDDREVFRRELQAIAMLVEAHRDEFDAAVAGLESTVSLAELRAKKRRTAQMRRR